MIKIYRYFFILFFLVQYAYAQKIPDYGYNKIRIAESEKSIQFETLPVTSFKAELEKVYYWYAANAIHRTTGGYSGKVLDGAYKEYYLNKNLKEAGQFKAGLMDGLWKSWDEEGNLLSAVTWASGIENGPYALMDSLGRKREAGSYRNGLRQGKVIVYLPGDSISVQHFNKGSLVIARKPFYKRIRLFKKRVKPVTAQP